MQTNEAMPNNPETPGSQTAKPQSCSSEPGKTVAQVIASDEALTRYFINEITERVDARMDERDEDRQKTWKLVGWVLALIGVGGLSLAWGLLVNKVDTTLKDRFEEANKTGRTQLIADIKNELASSMLKENEALKRDIAIQSIYTEAVLNAQTLKYEQKSFNNQLRTSLMDALEALSKSTLKDRSGFSPLLEMVVDSFYSAGLKREVSRIVELFPKETSESQGITLTLIQHYGERLVGEALPPDRWSLSDVKSFDLYEQSCRNFKIPEAAMPYSLLVEFRRANNQTNALTVTYLSDMKTWTPEQQARVHFSLLRLTDWRFWQRRQTAEGSHITEVCKAFRKAHRDEIAKQIASVDVEMALSVLAAVAEEDLRRLVLSEIRAAQKE